MASWTKKDVNAILMEVVTTFVSVIDEKGEYLKGHCERVARSSVGFARGLHLPDSENIQMLLFAGLLHDFGMVYVPLDTLTKPGPLDEEEMTELKLHPVIAEKVFSNFSMLRDVLPIIRHHHESFDGSGYPDGLRGNEIPVGARVFRIIDSYDAMTSPRAHRDALSVDETLEEIAKGAGREFDPEMVDAFIDHIKHPDKVAGNAGTGTRAVEGRGKGRVPDGDKGTEKTAGQAERKERPMVRKILKDIVRQFQEGKMDPPVMPEVINEIQKVLHSPSANAESLARVIEQDAVISLKLIAVANSPFYRGVEKIRSVRNAIPRLGLKETENIVSAVSNKNLYRTGNAQFRKLMETLWKHSLACAYVSREISEMLSFEDTDKYFLMGLMHDIGKVLLLNALSKILSRNTNVRMEDVNASIQQLHCNFGGALLKRWNFEQEYIRVATMHEGSSMPKTAPKTVLVVHLANNMTRNMGYSVHEEEVDLAELESVASLDISIEKVVRIQDAVKKFMQEAITFF